MVRPLLRRARRSDPCALRKAGVCPLPTPGHATPSHCAASRPLPPRCCPMHSQPPPCALTLPPAASRARHSFSTCSPHKDPHHDGRCVRSRVRTGRRCGTAFLAAKRAAPAHVAGAPRALTRCCALHLPGVAMRGVADSLCGAALSARCDWCLRSSQEGGELLSDQPPLKWTASHRPRSR